MLEKIKRIFSIIGPGFITGAADDDPSGIGTYSQTGAQFGYSQLWVSLFSFPFMTIVQEICGRIGIVTGKGLAQNIKEHYPKKILYFSVILLLIANTINIGADLGAMASSAQLLINLPFVILLLLITIITLVLEVFVSYKTYSKYLKYLTFSLFSYIVVAFIIKEPWKTIAISTIIPSISFNKDYLLNIVAILGTTISPYLFFWQSNEEVEEEISKGLLTEKKLIVKKGFIAKMRIDTTLGMFFSNLIMFFIILSTASTLHINSITQIQTASDAAQALRPLTGDFTFILFAAGIIGTGLLAVPVLAGSASYAIAETFNIKEGLYRKFKEAHGFYGIITIAIFIGLIINFLSIPPFQLLYYTAVANGVIAPPLMIIIMLMSNNKKVLGEHTNSRLTNILGWIITVIMFVCAISLIISNFI